MRPLVSILIPCYNAVQYLPQALESALTQTWRAKEIIVVDDGSADDSAAVAKKFESGSVTIVRQENRGASAARNRALKEAQGDFIQYLDADDLLAPDKIERQVKLSREVGNEFLVSGAWARFHRRPSEAVFSPQTLWTDLSPVDWLVIAWREHLMMHPAAWLVPRPLVGRAGPWNEELSLNDDGEYFCRVVLASSGVRFCGQAKSYYRSGLPASLSASRSKKALDSAFLSLDLSATRLLMEETSPRTRRVCADAFQKFIYDAYPDCPNLLREAARRVTSLGGSDVRPFQGPRSKLLSKVVGWKCAKRIRLMASRVNRTGSWRRRVWRAASVGE